MVLKMENPILIKYYNLADYMNILHRSLLILSRELSSGLSTHPVNIKMFTRHLVWNCNSLKFVFI
jgi:hypothetical protein